MANWATFASAMLGPNPTNNNITNVAIGDPSPESVTRATQTSPEKDATQQKILDLLTNSTQKVDIAMLGPKGKPNEGQSRDYHILFDSIFSGSTLPILDAAVESGSGIESGMDAPLSL